MSTFLTVAFILLSVWLFISLILNGVPDRKGPPITLERHGRKNRYTGL